MILFLNRNVFTEAFGVNLVYTINLCGITSFHYKSHAGKIKLGHHVNFPFFCQTNKNVKIAYTNNWINKGFFAVKIVIIAIHFLCSTTAAYSN